MQHVVDDEGAAGEQLIGGPRHYFSGVFFIPKSCAPECIRIHDPTSMNAKVTWTFEAVLVVGSTVAIIQAAHLATPWSACMLLASMLAVVGWRCYNDYCLLSQGSNASAEQENVILPGV